MLEARKIITVGVGLLYMGVSKSGAWKVNWNPLKRLHFFLFYFKLAPYVSEPKLFFLNTISPAFFARLEISLSVADAQENRDWYLSRFAWMKPGLRHNRNHARANNLPKTVCSIWQQKKKKKKEKCARLFVAVVVGGRCCLNFRLFFRVNFPHR